MGSAPEITFFLPMYNAARTVRETVASVLGQTDRDFEFLVVDDGSKDDSAAIVESFQDPRLRLVRQSNRGVSATAQWALENIRSPWIARVDADDISLPDRLQRQRAWIRAHPKGVLCAGALIVIDEEGRVIGRRKYPETHASILRALPLYNCIAQPAAVFHRETALYVGGYDPSLPVVEDYDLWLRMAKAGEVANLPDPLIRYRVHTGSSKLAQMGGHLAQTLVVRKRAVERYGYPKDLRFLAVGLALAILSRIPRSLVLLLFKLRFYRRGAPA